MKTQLDVISFLSNQYELIQKDISHCYPEQYDSNIAHPILIRNQARLSSIQDILNKLNYDNDLLHKSLQFLKQQNQCMIKQINFSYPDNSFDIDKGHITLCGIQNYINSSKQFISLFKNEKFMNIYPNISIWNILSKQYSFFYYDYDYTYPSGYFNALNANTTSYSFLARISVINSFISNIIELSKSNSDIEQTTRILNYFQNENKNIKNYIDSIYPNNYYDSSLAHHSFSNILTKLKMVESFIEQQLVNFPELDEMKNQEENNKSVINNAPSENISHYINQHINKKHNFSNLL